MIKTFYKKKLPIKLFFSSDMKYRTVAYGPEILSEYLSWIKLYNSYRANNQKSFWLSEQGEIGNNLLKGPYEKSYRNVFYYKERKSESVLCPLLYNEYIYEIDEKGHLFINGNESVFLINNPKAWALMAVSERDNIMLKLMVIGGAGKESAQLAFFDINDEVVTLSKIKPITLPPSTESVSYLLCLGKHLFTVHNGILRYYYINLDKNEAEEVAIGTDCVGEENELCKDIQRCVVADQTGRIYWCTEKSVYSMRIGSPKNVFTVETLKERDIVKLQTYRDQLMIYSKNSSGKAYACHAYRLTEGEIVKREIGYNLYQTIIADATPSGLRYVQISPSETEFVNEYGTRRSERVFLSKKATDTSFYLCGNIITGARAVGCDKERNYIIIY